MLASTRTRRSFTLVVIGLLLGLSVGAWVGDLLAHRSQRRDAEAQLDRYADRLVRTGEEVAAETDAAVRAVATDGLPFCSDAELSFMRNWVYNARHVRDIGRVRDGQLYCASGIGRLDPPIHSKTPDLEVNGMRVNASIPLVLSDKSRGFVVESHGVSVVLNPAVYTSLDEPPMTFGGWLRVPRGQQNFLLFGFGHKMPLTDAELLAATPVIKDGFEYHPKCASRARLCVAAAEPVANILVTNPRETLHFVLVGALLGSLLAAVVLLLLRAHRSLEAQLRRAIRRGDIRVEYQPVVSLSTGKIVAAEALARWNDEAGMPIPPSLFISIAEQKGFVGELTRLMVERSVRELGDQMRSGLRVTLNVAPQDLQDEEFARFLPVCLERANVPASSLGLEITERSTANHTLAIAAIERLKRAGHAVYLDDFGTGYSSLSYLHELAVDGIKIDRTFTQTVGTEAVTASVVPQVLVIARELGLQVVIEGIENQRQADYFTGSIAGLPVLGQGWHFGNPMPATQLKERLAAAR